MKSMKQINLILATFCVAMMMSCGKKESVTETLTEQQEQSIKLDEIELNNGQRWLVNDEMKPFIKASENLFVDYINSQDTNHKKLAQDLKTNADALLKSCTMEGKAHDELHKWLHPYLEKIKQLQTAEMADEVANAISEIKTSFGIYHQNFQ